MQVSEKDSLKTIIDREKLMQIKTCAACRRPFNLGDPVVLACGAWDGPPKLIHENEAVYDEKTASYIERHCFEAQKQG